MASFAAGPAAEAAFAFRGSSLGLPHALPPARGVGLLSRWPLQARLALLAIDVGRNLWHRFWGRSLRTPPAVQADRTSLPSPLPAWRRLIQLQAAVLVLVSSCGGTKDGGTTDGGTTDGGTTDGGTTDGGTTDGGLDLLPADAVWVVPQVTYLTVEIREYRSDLQRTPVWIRFVAARPQGVTKTVKCNVDSVSVDQALAQTNAENNGAHVAIHDTNGLWCDGEPIFDFDEATAAQGCEDDCAPVGVLSFDASAALVGSALYADHGYRGIERLNADGTVVLAD